MNDRPAILERLRSPQRAGRGWLAFCPAHDDQTKRSLSVGVGDDGRTLLKCHALTGCTTDSITRAVQMTLADLAPPASARSSRRRVELSTYDYTDAAGTLVFQVVRFEPKDFRCRRPVGDGWAWNLDGTPLVPYRAVELAEAARVFVAEGEKDCDALAALGLVATCNHGGAGKWRGEHSAALVAAAVPEVVALRDNDAAGASHQALVATSCASAHLRVKLLDLPSLPPKGDVSDFIAARRGAGCSDEKIRDELIALADATPLFVAAPGAGAAMTANDGPVLVRLDRVVPRPVSWHWPQRIAHGKVNLVIGEAGAGKSSVLDDVAARTTRGMSWPDGGQAPIGDVLMLTAEDGLADEVRPRIERQGGDPARVQILRAVRVGGAECAFNLQRDLPVLESALASTRAQLVVVSPLSSYIGAADSFKDTAVRAVLDPLAALAERLDVAIVGIMHLTKDQTRSLINRAQGNIAFVAIARLVLAVGKDLEHPGRRLLVSVKNNLGPDAPALAFAIADAGLTWEPTPIIGTAERLLAGDELLTRSDARERDTAAAFLRELLRDGPVASRQVEADARANGLSQRTLWRAKGELGIVADRAQTQDGKRHAWYWRLPQEPV